MRRPAQVRRGGQVAPTSGPVAGPYGYHMVMGRRQTLVQLTDDQVAALDAMAGRRGRSRSSLIRGAVDDLLAADERAEAGRRIVEGYRRIPPGTPDEWGDLEAMAERAAAETSARLDAEERAAGQPPW